MRSYDEAGAAIDRILERGGDADEVLRGVVQALAAGFGHYACVGIYFVEEGELALGPYQGSGPPDEGRIPIGRGVCGAAAASGETTVVDENRAASGSSRAQIAVPISWQGVVIGVIAVASDRLAAFTTADRAFLELLAGRISAHCLVGWDTGGVPWDEMS